MRDYTPQKCWEIINKHIIPLLNSRFHYKKTMRKIKMSLVLDVSSKYQMEKCVELFDVIALLPNLKIFEFRLWVIGLPTVISNEKQEEKQKSNEDEEMKENEKKEDEVFVPIVVLPVFTSKYCLFDGSKRVEGEVSENKFFKELLTIEVEVGSWYDDEYDEKYHVSFENISENEKLIVRFPQTFRTCFLEKTVSLERISLKGLSTLLHFSLCLAVSRTTRLCFPCLFPLGILPCTEVGESLLKNMIWQPKSLRLQVACPIKPNRKPTALAFPPYTTSISNNKEASLTSKSGQQMYPIDYIRSFVRDYPVFSFSQSLCPLKLMDKQTSLFRSLLELWKETDLNWMVLVKSNMAKKYWIPLMRNQRSLECITYREDSLQGEIPLEMDILDAR